MRASRLLAGVLSITAIAAVAATAQAEDFYAGKTLTVVIGSGPGGGQDRGSRFFARYWADHIPGKPNIIVQNLTGAGGTKAMNFVYRTAKPDGLTVYWGQYNPVGTVIGDPVMTDIDFNKMVFVGGIGNTLITDGRLDIVEGGLKDPADIVKAKGLKLGGVNPLGQLDLLSRLGLDIMGVDFTFVPGYQSAGRTAAAMLQGEVQMATESVNTYILGNKEKLEGVARPLWYYPEVNAAGELLANKTAEAEGIPSFVDVYKKAHGKDPSGPQWDAYRWLQQVGGNLTMVVFMPPDTPPEVAKILRDSYAATLADPAFLAEFKKTNGVEPGSLPFDDAQKILENYKKVDPSIVDIFKKYSDV